VLKCNLIQQLSPHGSSRLLGHLNFQKCSKLPGKLYQIPTSHVSELTFHSQNRALQQSQLPKNDWLLGWDTPLWPKELVTFLLSLFWGYCSLRNLFKDTGKNLPFFCFQTDRVQHNPKLFLRPSPVSAGSQGVLAGSRSSRSKHTLLTSQQPSNPTLRFNFQTAGNDNSMKNVI